MSDEQILAWYDHVRDDDGVPQFEGAATDRPQSLRQLHDRECFLNGVTEPEDVEHAWKEKQKRIAAYLAKKGKKKRGK